MSKTKLTIEIEEALYLYSLEQGEIVIDEVSIPDDWGRVDTLACRTKPDGSYEWRCYEIKVSKADFRSKAKVSFVGHYNYYVMPNSLYEKVCDEIPVHVGVMVYLKSHKEEQTIDSLWMGNFLVVKKPTRQALVVDEGKLFNAFFHSLFREVQKAKQTETGLKTFSDHALLAELRKRQAQGHSEGFYNVLKKEYQDEIVGDLTEELEATIAENHDLRLSLRKIPRETEPIL